MSAVIVQFNKSQHNTFLHISQELYRRILNGKSGFQLPLIQIVINESTEITFWCVQDLNIQDGRCVKINEKFGEFLKLKHDSKYEILVKEVAPVNLKKVIISMPDDSEDWMIMHSNFNVIEGLILDQIRLVRRGDPVPIFTKFKASPIWIKIEEFGGYYKTEKYGVLYEETELHLTADTSKESHIENDTKINLKILPSEKFYFAMNSCYNLSNTICSALGYSFRVNSDDSVSPGFIRVSNCILERLFKLPAKVSLNISTQNQFTENFLHFNYFSIDGTKPNPEVYMKYDETIFTHETGFVLKTNNSEGEKVLEIKSTAPPSPFNSLAEFIKNHLISQKVMLFYGNEGSGKSQMIFEAIQQLNYSESFNLPIKYIDSIAESSTDILENENMLISYDSLLILDHFDECFESNSAAADGDEESANLKYITILVRSPSSMAKFCSLHQLPIDLLFSLPAKDSDAKKLKFQRPLSAWKDVWGLEEAKDSLEKFIFNPLRFEAIYKANNMKVQAGVLLSGPSGSGKTFLACQFIRQFGLPSIEIRGPEILDKYVGSSERAVRDLFSTARRMRPCIIFFDEIDSIVPRRGSNQSGVTDRIVNQFLTELDGTEDRSGIFILATTSRVDLIDKALLRPGRIDVQINLEFPSENEINSIFKSLMNYVKSNPNTLSWADISAMNMNWQNPQSDIRAVISEFCRSRPKKLIVSKPDHQNQNDSTRQKLTLA